MDAVELNKISFEDARKTLKEWRDSGARRSAETVAIWENALAKNRSRLGDEVWVIYEQLCFAALDTHNLPIVEECLKTLSRRFPKSSRVLKLKGMFYESQGQFEIAGEIYDDLIQSDPANNVFRKRKVALFLAQSKRLEAIRELNDYLRVFLNDTEAWVQLSELFIEEEDLAKAVHCLEECVLISPLNSLFVRRLAEVRYSLGGLENIELAKSYYEQTVKHTPNDLRALYGIILSSNYIASHTKGASEKRKDVIGAGCSAADKIIEIYREAAAKKTNPSAPALIATVEQMKTELMTIKQ
ncbi:unnamed protein product [Auanema sp. JU1783]|nr:unnamed protein product [Auanema sp. JU1783]